MAKKVRVELDHDIEDVVFLKTDQGQLERIVISITLLPGNVAVYNLSCGEDASEHYGFEISTERKLFDPKEE